MADPLLERNRISSWHLIKESTIVFPFGKFRKRNLLKEGQMKNGTHEHSNAVLA